MPKASWIERVPTLEDSVAHVPLPPEADDDIDFSQETTDALADLFVYIEYTNAGGVSSRRPITIKKESIVQGKLNLFAYCHARKALRQFRVDRIEAVITVDGEVFQPASLFWKHVGCSYPDAVADEKQIHDDRFAATGIKRQFNHELVVLAALSGSDGNMHERELDQIVDYIERELEWERVCMKPGEVTALRNHLKRMRITRDRLAESVDVLLRKEGKHRLYNRQLDRFINTARQVATADEILHPAELGFLDYLRATITQS